MFLGNFVCFLHDAEDQNRQIGAEGLFHTAVLRQGALLVLMLTVGDWSDVLQVLITFLGEAACLLPSQDLLQDMLKVCTNNLHHSKNYIFNVSHLRCDFFTFFN